MKMYITAEEAAEILGVSRGYAYRQFFGCWTEQNIFGKELL